MRRWTNGLPGATARLGANLTPFEVFQLVSVGCARIPILAQSINAPHQRSDTLMQLSRSAAQHSALRRTAGPYSCRCGPVRYMGGHLTCQGVFGIDPAAVTVPDSMQTRATHARCGASICQSVVSEI